MAGCGADEPPAHLPGPTCPGRMAHLSGVDACIDRYEAVNEEGVAEPAEGRMPANGISWIDAGRACRRAGFRLCTRQEWHYACSGSTEDDGGRAFAYGDDYEQERCNSAEDGTSLTGRELALGGSYERCTTPEGVHDLSGNVSEWIDARDETGTVRELRGGSYGSYEKYAHCVTSPLLFQPPDAALDGYGFRCCTDAR